MAAMRALGHDLQDDNHTDALALLVWVQPTPENNAFQHQCAPGKAIGEGSADKVAMVAAMPVSVGTARENKVGAMS